MEASLKFHSLLSLALILACSILCESASDYGFTMELVHRDSPRSPYYNPANTPYQRMASALRRSNARVHRLNPNSASNPDSPSAVLVSDHEDGEYLMNVSLGNPPVTIVGIADTGSDLIWTQCKPCRDCFKQPTPLFDPSESSTYKDVSCRAPLCGAIKQTVPTSCGEGAGLCEYYYPYVDNTFSNGTLATETLTIGCTSGRPVSFPKVLFGCAHGGNISGGQMSGIIGLGGGEASLISQMGKATGGKFSYCLVPFFSDHGRSSKLNFGANAVVAGSGVVSTPLIQKKEQMTYYYLTLEAVSVGKTRIEFTYEGPFGSEDEGNIIIDSGSPGTQLPQHFYTKIEAAMFKSVKLPPVSTTSTLCYKAETNVGLGIPTVTFHFKGADVALGAGNSFVQVAHDRICFTLSSGEPAIYGNLMQMNYLVGYDTQNMKLSFKQVDCTLN